MRLWKSFLTIFSIASICLAGNAFPSGTLRRCTTNPRYFCDGNGRVIILTGSHTWNNFQDMGTSDPPGTLSYTAYLNFLKRNNHNFFRLWVWEQTKWAADIKGDVWFAPAIYSRTGTGSALDGKPRFDLGKFNEDFFKRLRKRVIQARGRGIYVSVMLFNGWSIDGKTMNGENPWRGHPFNRSNNINGIDGDGNGTGFGLETHTLGHKEITGLQESYVKKVIDTLNDLDNVLWEISNESPPGSELWQYHFIDFIKNYESQKPHQHPVGMSITWPGGSNLALTVSQADWISPNEWGITSYKNDPPEGNGDQVIIVDTDHLWGIGGDHKWAWKSFLRGLNPIFMDPYKINDFAGSSTINFPSDDPEFVQLRLNLGYIRTFSDKVGLAAMSPRSDLTSTEYCLADPGSKYLVYQPTSTSFSVKLEPGTYDVDWFNPVTARHSKASVTVNSLDWKWFTIPAHISDDAVLLLKIRAHR